MLTVGSLFAGIGGFDLAAERVGFEVKWQVEIDPYAQRVLEKHWPHVRRYGDIRGVDWSDVEPVDLVCGGFPCQPHSVAGAQLGAADDRDLWPEYRRCIRGLGPRGLRWVVAENVSGILATDTGRFFGGVLRDLAACGMCPEWDCIPASAVGANHQRDRVWIVAYSDSRRAYEEQERFSGRSGALHTRRNGQVRQMAHAHGSRLEGRQRQIVSERAGEWPAGSRGASVGDSNDQRELQPQGRIFDERRRPTHTSWWGSEPDVGRVAHGVPARVDRLRGLGNAIVPQVAEFIFSRIKEAEGIQ